MRYLYGINPNRKPTTAIIQAVYELNKLVDKSDHITFIVADLHAYLQTGNNMSERGNMYLRMIRCMCQIMKIKCKYEIIMNSELMSQPRYYYLVLKIGTLFTSDVLENVYSECEDSKINANSSQYVLMQCLDAAYLNIDIHIGESRQKYIFDITKNIEYSKIGLLLPEFKIYDEWPESDLLSDSYHSIIAEKTNISNEVFTTEIKKRIQGLENLYKNIFKI